MIIDTTPKIITLDSLNKNKLNTENGILNYQKEIDKINLISQEDINEARRIRNLLKNLELFEKKDSKKEALSKCTEKLKIINSKIEEMKSKNKTEEEI